MIRQLIAIIKIIRAALDSLLYFLEQLAEIFDE